MYRPSTVKHIIPWVKNMALVLVCAGIGIAIIRIYMTARQNVGAVIVLQSVHPSLADIEYFGWIGDNMTIDEARLQYGAQLASCCKMWNKPASDLRWEAIGIIGDNLDQAQDALAAARRQDPFHPMLQAFQIRNYEQLAKRALRANELVSAINYISQSDQIAPLIAYRHKKLYQSFCIEWYQQEHWRAAKAACQRILNGLSSRENSLLLAQIDFQLGDLSSARQQFERLENQYPDWQAPQEWLRKIEEIEAGR